MKPSTACQRLLVFAVVLFLLLVSAGRPLAGQTAGAGNIVGTVTDSSGAAVPNATVVITNTDTGAIRTLTTNSTGSYTANFLQSGQTFCSPATMRSFSAAVPLARSIARTSRLLSARRSL